MAERAFEFAQLNEQGWRALAGASLKGASLDGLNARFEDGIILKPVYGRVPAGAALRQGRDWRVMARVDDPDPERANAQLLEDLEGGADGLDIVFAGAAGAYGFGVAAYDSASLHRIFAGLRFDAGLRLTLGLGPQGPAQALAVAALIARAGVAPPQVDVAFGLDPLGALARSGRFDGEWAAAAAALGAQCADLRARGFRGPLACADARVVHDAGGTPAQELAYALAAGVAYLRALAPDGLAQAFTALEFRLSADADQFASLAKFRAMRLLWARVGEACDAPAPQTRLHASSAWRMLAARDPFANVMRGALAAFSAGLGGADGVGVLPHTQAIGLPNAFARRLARNAQLILLKESHLGFVGDPAAGSGAIEALTAALCEKAWALFQGIEGRGGLFAALVAGAFQGAVGEAAAARARAVATLETPLIGVSAYPDLAEAEAETLPATRPAFAYAGERRAAPLEARRLAEPFEALRKASDAALTRSGERPKIFLANLGAAVDARASAAFARGLFALGGIEGSEGAPEAFGSSGARLACLCGSDAACGQSGEAAALALRAAGARAIYVAARPDSNETRLRAAGVEDFIFAGCDALQVLQGATERA